MGGSQSQHFLRVSDAVDPLMFWSFVSGNEDQPAAELTYNEVTEPEHKATLIMHPAVVYRARWRYRINSKHITMLRMYVAVKDWNDPNDKRGLLDLPKPINRKVPIAAFGNTVLHFTTDFPIAQKEHPTIPFEIEVSTNPFAPRAYGPETRVAAWFYICDQDDNVLVYYGHDRVVSETYGLVDKPPFSVPLIQAPNITARSKKHVDNCSQGYMDSVSAGAAYLYRGVARALTSNLESVADPMDPAVLIEPITSIPKVPVSTANSAQSMATLDATLSRGGSTRRSGRHPEISKQQSLALGTPEISNQDMQGRMTKLVWYNRRVSLSVLQFLAIMVALIAIAWSTYLTLMEQHLLIDACLKACPHKARVADV